jgi:uncharacterized protein YdbL (DUF1318 family)
MRHHFLLGILSLALPLAGCMHITMDVNANVNVNVKLDKALDDFFNDLDKSDATMEAPATPAPTTPGTAVAAATAPSPAPAGLSAQDAELRARMKQRQPQIDRFKESGALGENNLGYLEARNNQEGAAALAAAANADRKTIYQRIAAKQNVGADEVGQTRARQIAQKSAPGVWIQDAQGAWTKK